MGRVKLKIKQLENINSRLATYAKRKNGIMKKAIELSILCDVDIILIMFSPNGKPSLCMGKYSNFEEIIIKFAQLTSQEREKRKLENLEVLKKTFKKLDHDVIIQDSMGMSTQTIEDLCDQARLLQTHIYEIHKRLSYWTDLGNSNSVEQLRKMENSLKESLNQIRSHKENIQKQQFASLQCNNQFNEMHVPFRMDAQHHLQPLSCITNDDNQNLVLLEDSNLLLHKMDVQHHLQPLSWITNGDNQNLVLLKDSNSLLHKDIEGSTSYSFGSYANYLGSSNKTDISISKQENGVLNDMRSTSPPRLQLPYLPNNINLLNDMDVQLTPEMKPNENHVDYNVNGSFEAPRTEYDSNHQGLTSTSGPCVVTMFDEHLYTQPSFPPMHLDFT